ncbi:MAG TPA: YggT family protein [Candidatus Hydrogenedentes bacterium]|nr:YggT family protein [Candidatus Hydrogenedentota bacterium]HOS02896.1 YggT family protein [Candidatus Hydrogenedentota bacterium]
MTDTMLAMLPRGFFNVCTLYMLFVLLRWFGSYLEIDLYGRFRWICRITDPAFGFARRKLPPLGPVDFAPAAVLFAVWIVREMVASLLASVVR